MDRAKNYSPTRLFDYWNELTSIDFADPPKLIFPKPQIITN